MRMLIPLMLGALAQTAVADDAPWLRCADRTEAAERLACYDALAASRRGRPASAAEGAPRVPAPAAQAAVTSGAAAAVSRFGATERAEPDALHSQLSGNFEGWGPRSVFTLANGQRWAVADGSSAVLWLQSPKVTVRRAALGGYRIEFEGSNQTARVRRVD